MVFIRVTDTGRYLTDTDPADEKKLIRALMRFYTHKLKMQPSVFSPFISIALKKAGRITRFRVFQVFTRAF